MIAMIQPIAGVSPSYPPVSIGIAFLVVRGYRNLPWILACEFVISMFQYNAGFLAGLIVAMCATLECLIGAAFIKAWIPSSRPHSAGAFVFAVIAGGGLSTFVGATVGSLALQFAIGGPSETRWSSWQDWWLSDATSIFAFLPAILLWQTTSSFENGSDEPPRKTLEWVWLLLLTLLLNAWVFLSSLFLPRNSPGALHSLCMIPVIWTALRFTPRWTAIVVSLTDVLIVAFAWLVIPILLSGNKDSFDVLSVRTLLMVQSIGGMGLAMSIHSERVSRAKAVLAAIGQRHAQDRLEFIVKSAPTLIYACTSSELFDASFVSPLSRKILGFSPDELTNNPRLWSDQIHPEDLQRVLSNRRSLSKVIPHTVVEYRFLHKNGEYRWLRDEVVYVEATPGDAEVVGFCVDITESVEATELLRVAEQKAQDANRTKSEFLANMSHEIRTPMTAILGYANLLEDRDNNLSESDQREFLQIIRHNGEQLLTIINDILDLARVESGKMILELVEIQPITMLREVQALMQVNADSKKLSLSCSAELTPKFSLISDLVRLRQILVNIVGNAIKFTETGSVSIRCCLDPADPKRVLFEVADTGIGITQEHMGRLFGAFDQADGTASRTRGGTGLGLNISKRLTELLGGTIGVESKIGKGSTFRISLQCVYPKAVDPQAIQVKRHEESIESVPKLDHQLAGVRILYAEDGIDNQRLVAFHLRRAGAEVQIAENGLEALKALGFENTVPSMQEIPFHLLLTDMQMPIMDGFELVRRMRGSGCTMPVIALTAHSMSGDRDRCIDCGCDEYLTKPINRTTLLNCCTELVRKEKEPIKH